MATETLRPNGAGSETNLSTYAPNTGEANWEDVDEAEADDLTTCLYTYPNSATWKRDLYAIPDHSEGSGTINSVTIHWRIRGGSQGVQSKSALKTHNTIYDGTEKSHGAGATWYDESQQYTTNPNTGSAWTWDEVDAMEIGISAKTSDDSGNAYPTQVYVVIDYTVVTEKQSSETGSGEEAILSRSLFMTEEGTGLGSLGSRLLAAVEQGAGAETLLARLLTSTETATGLDAGGLIFISSDVGSGLDAILALEAWLTGADSGSGIDTAFLIKALLSTDSGLGTDAVAALLAGIVAGELMVGSDRLVVKIESAPTGGGMSLPPGGKTSIPSRRVNL